MKTVFYIILLLITVSSCTKETLKNDTNEEPIFSNVIYLDFDGAGLSDKDQIKVLNKVQGYFNLFKVTITRDQDVFNAANVENRQEVILTYGDDQLEPGIAFVNSFGKNDPCYVYTNLIYYNPERIAIIAAHEIGHTLNLYHQSEYDENCTKTNEYRKGSIMGIVDLKGNDHWTIGQCRLGCDSIQDDIKQIGEILNFR